MHLFADPEFWVLLAVVVFAIMVWKPARRAVVGSLDERATRIRGELEEARKLRDEAEQLLADYRQKEREAAADAQAIIAHARDEAERIAAQAARDRRCRDRRVARGHRFRARRTARRGDARRRDCGIAATAALNLRLLGDSG